MFVYIGLKLSFLRILTLCCWL